jgi:hypothetical protein
MGAVFGNQASVTHGAVNHSGGRALYVSSVVILLLGLTNLSTVLLRVLLVPLMLAPVFYGFRMWLRLQGDQTSAPTWAKDRLGVLQCTRGRRFPIHYSGRVSISDIATGVW